MAEINNPVDLTAYANTIANNPHAIGSDWGLACYDATKKFIKIHYSVLQDDTCCYCKIPLRFAGYGEPIEHIVPKNDKPEWMFEPKNLALSCYPCNTKKNADNTLSALGKLSVNYPFTADGFIIYHPHYNTWENHFKILHQYFLIPKTQKGRETFKVCELYRLNLPLDKAKMKGLKEMPFKSRVISAVFADPNSSRKLLRQCEQITLTIIDRAKLKKKLLDGN